MLHESYMLLKSLRGNKIALPSYHPRVKSPGKSFGNTVRVVLSPHGEVSSVSEMTDEEVKSLWTIREGNQNSFPVVRLASPLADLQRKDRQLIIRLRDIKAAEIAALSPGTSNPYCELLISFARAFMLASKDIDALLISVCEKITEAQQNGRIEQHAGQNLQLAFDIATDSIYRREVRDFVEATLCSETSEKLSDVATTPKFCALTRETDVLSSPFPAVHLPILSKEFPLFSMFGEAKCNIRYGLQDSEVISISGSVARDIARALLWVTDDDRRGKTWRGIARGEYAKQGKNKRRSEQRDLLIVYVDGTPDISIEIANLFGTDQDSIVKQFEADAGTVCNVLKGVAKQRPESKLNLLVIRDVSKGQAQVVISESFAVGRFFKAVEQWQRAVKGNVPPIEVMLPPSPRGENAIIASPPVPYPDEIVKILSRKYISLGLDARDVRGVSFGEVLDFMLRTEGKWKDACQKMLNLTLQDYEPLLVGLFGAKLRLFGKYSSEQEKQRWKKYSEPTRKDALRAVSLIGLILDAYDRSKENYMKDAAFKIGGFLALADILHKDYCVVVRNNSLPPSLIGNAMMPRTFDNPRLAVADIADRMRVYTGWAKTARIPDDNEEKRIAVLEAKKTLVRYEPLAKELHDIGLPEQCNNEMKAEVLLGYLASTKGIDTETDAIEKEIDS